MVAVTTAYHNNHSFLGPLLASQLSPGYNHWGPSRGGLMGNRYQTTSNRTGQQRHKVLLSSLPWYNERANTVVRRTLVTSFPLWLEPGLSRNYSSTCFGRGDEWSLCGSVRCMWTNVVPWWTGMNTNDIIFTWDQDNQSEFACWTWKKSFLSPIDSHVSHKFPAQLSMIFLLWELAFPLNFLTKFTPFASS